MAGCKGEATNPNRLQKMLADAIQYKSPMNDIRTILHTGASLDAPVIRGLRPIHYAVYENYVDCVRYLVEQGCDVNVQDDVGYTPVHLCARHGILPSMKLLIDHGCILNFCDGGSDVSECSKRLGYLTIDPLNLAIDNNHTDCVRMLLEHGAKPNHKYFLGYEINLVPLENLECLELLLQYGADPDSFNRSGMTLVMKACKQHRMDAIKLLLKYGASVNAQCPPRFDQKTVVHHAIQSGSLEITKLLLDHGAETTRPNNYKHTPLETAITSGRLEICDLLIARGCDVNVLSEDGVSPLMLLCSSVGVRNQAEIAELLLTSGADPNYHAKFMSYATPCLSPLLEYLTYNDDMCFDLIHTLIRHGGRVNIRAPSRLFKLTDAYGVLKQLERTYAFPNVFEILLEAAEHFDIEAIEKESSLTAEVKKVLMGASSTPRSLRQICRFRLRGLLGSRKLPALVNRLPLPEYIKSYLLFEL